MQRSRSPIRFRRERSPSIISLHSREPSRERSFSISSLSSCSIGQTFSTNRNLPQNSVETDRREDRDIEQRENRGPDSRRNKRHGRNKNANKRHDKGRHDKKENEQERSTQRDYDRNFSRNSNRPRPSSHRQSDDDLLDPSVSLQEQTTYRLQSSDLELDQRSSNRLDRLEKLLEKLLYKKTRQQQQPQQQSSTSSFIPENSDNPFELNPRNTVFTTSMWLNRINEECLEKNYDEKNCIQYMQSRMTGLMKAWFKTLDIYEYSWPELKMLVIRTFPDNVEFSMTLRLLVDRYKKPEETITQYYFSKMYLLEACKITGANAVSCLIDGLADPYLQQEAKGHTFLTPETLYSQFFTKLPNFGIQQPYLEPDNGSRNIDEYLETPRMEEDLSVPMPRAHPVSSSAPSRSSLKKCFTCKKIGHIAADCRHAPLCYRCNKEGHIAAKCPRN